MSEDEYGFDWPSDARRRLVLLSGCSGGGKSTLLAALARRGYAGYEEPGRQIVKEQSFISGEGLPWADPVLFAELLVSRAMHQMASAVRAGGTAIFDRGLVEPYAWFRRSGLAVPASLATAVRRLRYADTVLLAPPWPEIFAPDAERRHGFAAAEAEYHALVEAFAELGYATAELPKADVETRVRFVAERIGPPIPSGTP